MKKLIFLLFVTLCYTNLFSQVGVGTTNPKSTLDIIGKPTIVEETDGLLPPRLLRSELINKTGYGTDQIAAIVYITDLSGTNNSQTINVTEIGYYYFNGTIWVKMVNNNIPGDIKSGLQSTDHNGWVKLDGRVKTTLTVTQQAQATALGIGANLPDASNAYLSQNGSSLGSVSGDNTTTIAQNQLPNVTLSTSSDGEHKHAIRTANNDINDSTSQGYPTNDVHQSFRTTDRNQRTETGDSNALILSGGSHTHTTTSINGNVTQQSIDTSPRTLSVNMFIYLGN